MSYPFGQCKLKSEVQNKNLTLLIKHDNS